MNVPVSHITQSVSDEARRELYEAGEEKYEKIMDDNYNKELRKKDPEQEVFDYVEQGNLDAVAEMYESGAYAPRDLDPDTLLFIRLHFMEKWK